MGTQRAREAHAEINAFSACEGRRGTRTPRAALLYTTLRALQHPAARLLCTDCSGWPPVSARVRPWQCSKSMSRPERGGAACARAGCRRRRSGHSFAGAGRRSPQRGLSFLAPLTRGRPWGDERPRRATRRSARRCGPASSKWNHGENLRVGDGHAGAPRAWAAIPDRHRNPCRTETNPELHVPGRGPRRGAARSVIDVYAERLLPLACARPAETDG